MVFAPSPKRIQVMQMMMSCLPRLLPWAFKDHPATRDELDLLKMLAEQKYDKFNAAIDKICAAYDFYGKKVESMLKGFCSQNFTRSIRSGRTCPPGREQRQRLYEQRPQCHEAGG